MSCCCSEIVVFAVVALFVPAPLAHIAGALARAAGGCALSDRYLHHRLDLTAWTVERNSMESSEGWTWRQKLPGPDLAAGEDLSDASK